MSVLVVQVEVGLSGAAVFHHRRQRAAVQAQLLTSVIDVAQDPLRAAMTQYLVGAVSGDALGAAVPVRDVPVQGDEVDAVGDLVKQVPVEVRVHRAPQPDPICRASQRITQNHNAWVVPEYGERGFPERARFPEIPRFSAFLRNPPAEVPNCGRRS